MGNWECKEHNQEEYHCFKLGEHETHVKRVSRNPTAYSHSLTIGSSLPVVHSLHTNLLISNGWVREGSKYSKGNDVLIFNGVKWILNGQKECEFLEDVENNKTPGD